MFFNTHVVRLKLDPQLATCKCYLFDVCSENTVNWVIKIVANPLNLFVFMDNSESATSPKAQFISLPDLSQNLYELEEEKSH